MWSICRAGTLGGETFDKMVLGEPEASSISNLSMHFRDRSMRETFCMTCWEHRPLTARRYVIDVREAER